MKMKDNKKNCLWHRTTLTISVAFLILAMIILVGYVGCTIYQIRKDGKEHVEIFQKIEDKLKDSINVQFRGADSAMVSVKDFNATTALVNELLKQEHKILRTRMIQMDNTSFSSILLALITLCATLAVVIPYITGKSIIKDEIHAQLSENKKELDSIADDFSKQVARTTTDGLWNDANNARMIAYLLLNSAKNADASQDTYYWTIGWASKAFSRYSQVLLSTDAKDKIVQTSEFRRDCIKYISKAIDEVEKNDNAFQEESSKERDVFIRMMKDIYVTLRLNKQVEIEGLTIQNIDTCDINKLREFGKAKLGKLNNENNAYDKICKMTSKYDFNDDSNESPEKLKKSFERCFNAVS